MQSAVRESSGWGLNISARKTLRLSGQAWFLIAAIGQWCFVAYIIALYVPLLSLKGLQGLDETHLPNGHVAGDLIGNLAIAAHILVAIVIIGGGPLQLIPRLRQSFPALHRQVGRTYLLFAFFTSIAGLYLVWTRGVLGGVAGHVAISLDAILILICGGLAIHYARARKFDHHRRWAMRLFMVVSAVWFFRIGMMFWFATTGGAGIDTQTFTGPFIYTWYFGQMALPLLLLEFYFWASEPERGAAWKLGAALIVVAATIAMSIGIFAAVAGMWLPRIV